MLVLIALRIRRDFPSFQGMLKRVPNSHFNVPIYLPKTHVGLSISSMRLLNSHTFELKEFLGGTIGLPNYVILSHTWGPMDEEVNFQDIQRLEKAKLKKGFRKIQAVVLKRSEMDINGFG